MQTRYAYTPRVIASLGQGTPIPGSSTLPAKENGVYSYLSLTSQGSFSSLQKNASSLDGLIVEALRLDNGKVVEINPAAASRAYALVRSQNKNIGIYASMSNYAGGGWQSQQTGISLRSSDARKQIISSLQQYALKNNLHGISLDLENLVDQTQPDLVQFCAELKKALSDQKISLIVHVPANDGAWDYKDIAKNSDRIVLMGYDQHWVTSVPGAIAEATWYDQAIAKIPAEDRSTKLIAGMASYGYDWVGNNAQSISYDDAVQNAKKYNAEIFFDSTAKSDTYSYTDSSGKSHVVWMGDAQSVKAETEIAKKYGVKSFAVYRLGTEDQDIWKTLK